MGLKILCPSVSDGLDMWAEPCTNAACGNWSGGRCTESDRMTEMYQRHLDQDPLPECPKAAECRWDLQAVASGERACIIRRFGEVCEHAGGDYNVNIVASPEELDER